MIELARAQDEEVGDGTTSVIILAGEVLSAVEGFLEKEIHPTVIVNAYFNALEEIVKITNEVGVSIKFNFQTGFSAILNFLIEYLISNFYLATNQS